MAAPTLSETSRGAANAHAAAVLADRYGTRRNRGVIIGCIIAGIIVGAFAIWYLWSAGAAAARDVAVNDRGFNVADENTVHVTFQITSTIDDPAVCTLEALDEGFGVVGWTTMLIEPSDAIHTIHSATIRTLAEATTGIVKGCVVQ